MNNILEQNVKSGQEYVTVNENTDLWSIDYDRGIADYCESITLDDLKVNNKEYTDLELDSIGSYLEDNGYVVDEDKSNETKIYFKRFLITRNCAKCNSNNTIKMGLTQSKTPKQKYYCKDCFSFFINKKVLS